MSAPNFAETTVDYFVAWLLQDYLGVEGSVEAGVPSVEVVPAHVMDDGEDMVCPCRVVAAKEMPGSTAARKEVNASVILRTLLAAREGAAVTGTITSRPVASGWMRKMEERLKDRGAFSAWVEALPEERRQGWSIMSYAVLMSPAPARDAKQGSVDYAVTVRVVMAVARVVESED